MSEEISNVADTVVDHSGAFETQTPSNDIDILRKSHGSEHFWTENTRVSYFDPLFELWVITEDLKTRLGVGIVSWLIL